jgi:thiol-disulfide isomerase/thioredoxin
MSVTRAERRRQGKSHQGPPRNPLGLWLAIGATLLVAAGVVAIAVVNRQAIPKSASDAPIYAPLTVGQKAPPFAVTTIDGRRIDSSALHGPILLEVFATWCPHCQRETATLKQLNERYGTSLSIVSVTGSDTGSDERSTETADDVRGFARYFKLSYPVAYDPDLTVAKKYLQGGFPTVVFISASKQITSVESGEIPMKKLTQDATKAGAKPAG